MSIQVKITGVKEVKKELRLFLVSNQKKVRTVVATSAKKIESNSKENAPVNTGRYRQSISSETFDKGYKARIGSNLKYAVTLEKGRRANKKPPPTDAIALWIKQKGLNYDPYAVARSIGIKGFKGKFIITKGFEKEEPIFENNIKKIFK